MNKLQTLDEIRSNVNYGSISQDDYCGVSQSCPQGSVDYREKYRELYEKVAQHKLKGGLVKC